MAYTYTATGQRRTMADGTGTTTYHYDALDRPITVTNGAGQAVGYGYDAVGNKTALTYPDASVVTRTYDALDHLSGIQDWLGHDSVRLRRQ
jgi:YD repeat-containing protein